MTIVSADIAEQLIFSFSLFNSLLQWIKRICLANSSVNGNFCNNIIVSHFCLHLSCNWEMTAQLFDWKVHCMCRHLRAQHILPTWNIFWISSVWSQQAKNQPDWTSFKWQGEQTSKEQVSENASSESGLSLDFFSGPNAFSPPLNPYLIQGQIHPCLEYWSHLWRGASKHSLATLNVFRGGLTDW